MSDIAILDIPFASGGGLTSDMRERLHPEFVTFFDQMFASAPQNMRSSAQASRMCVHVTSPGKIAAEGMI
jgi:hypothetical protein